MSWSDGYVTEIDYTPGYIPDINPQRATLPLLLAGLKPPKIETACELGFGLGVSMAVHAAASQTQWWGSDFNPSHAAQAQRLAAASGAGARAEAQAFADFCARDDLPDFDFIGLHGVWSWIDPDNRAVIANFIDRKLRVGGVVYVSYNCMPGWSAFAPIRHLIWTHVERQSAPGMGMVARVEAALKHIDALIELDPAYFRAIPLALERYKMMRSLDRRYLVHEFMTRHWGAHHVADMAQVLESARLSYAGSAHPIDHVDAMNLSPEQAKLLKDTPDPIYRETLRDLITNQQFRRDLWIKGPTRLDPRALREALLDLRIASIKPRAEMTLKGRAARGDITLKPEAFGPIADMIGKPGGATLGELTLAAQAKGLGFTHAVEAAAVFVSNGDAGVGGEITPIAAAQAQRYNAALARDVALGSRDDLLYLAAPLTGGGAPVTRAQLLCLAALADGAETHAAQADMALRRLAGGFGVTKLGSLEAEREALAKAAAGVTARLPTWRALGAWPQSQAAADTAGEPAASEAA